MTSPNEIGHVNIGWQDKSELLNFCRLLDHNAEAGSMARLVGGVVRDALLGIEAQDIDIATPHHPEKVMQIADAAGLKAIPTGIAHGTVTVVLGADTSVEVTTLRRDISTDGRHAAVAFSNNWQEDAARRDFTFNALYAEPYTGQVHDYFSGINDLKAGRVQFIGDARKRIMEDHLRIMRFFRFHAYYGRVPLDEPTLSLCAEMAPRLKALSRERISQELLRLIMAPEPEDSLKAFTGCDIWQHVLPEVEPDNIAILINAIGLAKRENVEAKAMTRLAILLPRRAELAAKVAARLRLSRRQKERLHILLSEKLEGSDDIIECAYFLGSDTCIQLAIVNGDPALLSKVVLLLSDWQRPKFPITGRDVMASGVMQGPKVAQVLQAGEKIWLRESCPDISDIPRYIERIKSSL